VRIFFATDVHGSEPTFRKFINAGKAYGVDVLILGGDITGKLLTPIIASGNQEFTATLQSSTYTLRGQQELSEFETRLGKLDPTAVSSANPSINCLQMSPARLQRFHQKASERLVPGSAWRRKGWPTPIFDATTGGNDDALMDALHREAAEWVVPCEDRVVALTRKGTP
jgi:Icc-related predicted phosphoesterase